MAAYSMMVSMPMDVRTQLLAEAEQTGLKMSTIIAQALKARWAAQDRAKTEAGQ